MPLSKIKNEFLNKRVAFGKTAALLHEREDIDDLAIMAHESQNKDLLKLFETLPALDVLKKARTEKQLKRNVAAAEVINEN